MKLWRILGIVLLLLIVAGGVRLWWKNGEPRRHSLASVQRLADALQSGNSTKLLDAVQIPQAIQGRTTAEQAEFLNKALRDEITPEGLALLKKNGRFGSLSEIFPDEAEKWATQAGVKVEDCVAFRMENRDGLRGEVVLLQLSSIEHPESSTPPPYRILRCNNVTAPAAVELSTKDQL